ncbi:NAD(P)-dependent alcohol dehydrogenase [Arthrobacter castelli]|uniref:NAD(P)-dependent alcohol dehydrogenase n=1 Tax=Arthrobacter castelli TaxID=271431 RepID=UPI000424E4F3|nr:NAD(P)-dependent alcohol dehydrogenase [Arthrobacter castelli]
MKAIVQDVYGTAEVLKERQIEAPVPAAGQVLVRVHAAGVDPSVWHLMTGLPYLLRFAGFGVRAPRNPVPGGDLAGVVAEVGGKVTRFRPGDAVFGIGTGTCAEYAPAREDKLAHKPDAMSFEQMAVVPISGLTALHSLRDCAHVTAGQTVLVVGASGGVGSYAVQIAKAYGADVTGVCSTPKLDFVRSLGADRVIDYCQQDFADGRRQYDVVVDIGGSSPLGWLRRALTRAGTLVLVGGEGGGRWFGTTGRSLVAPLMSPFVSQKLRIRVPRENHTDMAGLASLMSEGKMMPAIDRVYSLAEVPQAIGYLADGKARGKVAIHV